MANRCVLVRAATLLVVGSTPTAARADLESPTGNSVTGGLAAGAVRQPLSGTSGFLDGEVSWTYYPELAAAALAPGITFDGGYEFGSSRGRFTFCGKLGVLFFLGLEIGYTLRVSEDRPAHGPTARLRLNIPVGHLLYLSPYYRRSWVSDAGAADEFGAALKVFIWGEGKLEGVANSGPH